MIVLAKEIVSARLPQDRVNQLEEIAREEKVDKTTILDRALEHYIQEWRLQKAIKSYMEGTATLPRAAEIAHITVWEMLEVLADKNIQSQYDIDDLEDDLKALEND